MPRQPTGNPRGRPPGSGQGVGDDAPRLTVRLPVALYTRLEAFAEGYRYHRGDPPLAVCVREMIAYCLDHPNYSRQPKTLPLPQGTLENNSRLPENIPPSDTTRFYAGELCPKRHDVTGRGQSLRYVKGDRDCVTCRRERNARYNAQKRETRRQKAVQPQKG